MSRDKPRETSKFRKLLELDQSSVEYWRERYEIERGELEIAQKRIAVLKALLRETDDSEICREGCAHVVNLGASPCNCLRGRIQKALADVPSTGGEE